jgi:hypothetical protein|tara:strand:- start:12232 stop:13068 length:837 start_codon:yes stop_codon:yes gene_type:complete
MNIHISNYPMKSKSKKRKHRSEKSRYYIPFLPDDIFNNMNEKDREHQRLYRTYHRTIFDLEKKISDNQLKIQKLKNEIKECKFRLNTKSTEESEDGYKELMIYRWQRISHYYEDYQFNVSIERRNRSSKTFKKNRDGDEGFNKERLASDRRTYGGKEIGELFTYQAKVQASNYKFSIISELPDNNRKLKSIQLGTEEVMRMNLVKLYNDEDYLTDDLDIVRDEWRTIILAFSNYYIHKKKWLGFKVDTISKDDVMNWCNKMKISEKENEFDNWIPQKY